MKKIKIQCPAKINLNLKVFKKDETTGFHPIKSEMQTIDLYDFLTIETVPFGFELSGNSTEIKYDCSNLISKAADAFFKKTKIKTGVKIYIEKNIPVAAGLAGGSTDAAGVIFGLNNIFDTPLCEEEIFEINSSLGSDINFCYKGGRALAEGKGDNLTPLEFRDFFLTLVKPRGLKISTKSAYDAFDTLNIPSNLPNDLEFAISPLYPELSLLQKLGFQMSGSGPSFFIKNPAKKFAFGEKYEVFENLKSVPYGVLAV